MSMAVKGVARILEGLRLSEKYNTSRFEKSMIAISFDYFQQKIQMITNLILSIKELVQVM